MARLGNRAEKLACAVLCVSVAVFGATNADASPAPPAPAPPEPAVSTRPVFFDGRPVDLVFARARRAKTALRFGPWELDTHVAHEKPRDPHPNLYIVAPGDQYTSDQAPEFNHTEIISTIPVKTEPREWDVYWAIVLDPDLEEAFHSERQLLLATQDGFRAGPDFDLDRMPGVAFLREFLHVTTLADLDRFRRPDGMLPRVMIVPAGISMKATAVDPLSPPEEGKSAWSRALSAIFHSRNDKASARSMDDKPRAAQEEDTPPKR